MPSVSEFGALLRTCRGAQGMSQLDLSLAAGVSSRHLSFLETGRSQPSRSLVLRLGDTLALPLRSRNALLLAAGYAPAYQHRELSAEGLGPVRRALELLLESHEPYPALCWIAAGTSCSPTLRIIGCSPSCCRQTRSRASPSTSCASCLIRR